MSKLHFGLEMKIEIYFCRKCQESLRNFRKIQENDEKVHNSANKIWTTGFKII